MSNPFGILLNEQGEFDFETQNLKRRADTYGDNKPSFFTPYKNWSDFFDTLATPVTDPLFLSCITGASAIVSLLYAASSLINLALGMFYIGNSQYSSDHFKLALADGMNAAVFGFLSIIAAIVTPISMLTETTRLVTRIGATLASAVSDCCHSEEDEQSIAAPSMAG